MRIMMCTLVCFILASCSPYFPINLQGYTVKNDDLLTSWKLVASCTYSIDHNGYNKSPVEFFRSREGDCVDFSTALVYLLGPEAELIQIKQDSIIHAIVRYKTLYIDPQIYGRYYRAEEINIVGIWEYKDLMKSVTNLGTKGLQI
jgi:hypothetical protein